VLARRRRACLDQRPTVNSCARNSASDEGCSSRATIGSRATCFSEPLRRRGKSDELTHMESHRCMKPRGGGPRHQNRERGLAFVNLARTLSAHLASYREAQASYSVKLDMRLLGGRPIYREMPIS
jgi:hypothetical protein